MAPLAGGGPPADKLALKCVKTIARESQKLVSFAAAFAIAR